MYRYAHLDTEVFSPAIGAQLQGPDGAAGQSLKRVVNDFDHASRRWFPRAPIGHGHHVTLTCGDTRRSGASW